MTLSLTPEKRAHLASIGRLGGLTAAVTVDTVARATNAQGKFRAGFNEGHACSACPRIDLPVDLTPEERHRRSELLFRLHFSRIRRAR